MNRVGSHYACWIGIAIIALAIVVGPFFSPAQFSWVQHSTSEQAGQHMPGAWFMRLGFYAYGLGTFACALIGWRTRFWVRLALAVFGASLIATGIWSNASILPEFASDMHEDWLHSVASGIVGTAFAAACAARIFSPDGQKKDWLAWAGLAISVAIPLAMNEFPEFRGVLQRAMFGLSFVFVGREFYSPKKRN